MAKKIKHGMVSETLEGAVVGMLLGDGCVLRISSEATHCIMQIKHCAKQRQYLEYKQALLETLTGISVIEESRLDTRTGHTYDSVTIRTRQHPFYTRLRNDWYGTGHKAVSPFWLNKLDERGLAIWFMDDGWTGPSGCVLATMSFSLPENELLANVLWTRFGIHADVRRFRAHYGIRIPAKSQQCIRDMLLPYAEVCNMLYKLPHDRHLETS
jgi:hypothetical protein